MGALLAACLGGECQPGEREKEVKRSTGWHVHDLLANPIWSSLSSTHAAFAQTSGVLKRFAPEVAPFCAVEQHGADLGAAPGLHAGETVYFLGTIPQLPASWTVLGQSQVLQLVFDDGQVPFSATSAEAPTLTEADTPAMLALTAQVYPEYFRPRTATLGEYIGVHGPGRLDAMAGQRFACTGYREISAVCTHPERRGQGLAGRLIRQLCRMILAEGRIAFIHASASDRQACALYEKLGFAASRELRLVKVLIA